MGIFDDASLDARARAVLEQKDRTKPSIELLERATHIEEAPSPAMLEDTAMWLGIVDDLRAAGLTTSEITRICLRAGLDTFDLHGPSPDMLAHVLVDEEGLAIARDLCEELAGHAGKLTWRHQNLANAALGRLAIAGAIEPRFDRLFGFYPTEPSSLRAIIGSLPPERREALVLANATPLTGPGVNTPRSAAFIVDKLLEISDLVPMPAVLAAREKALAAAIEDDEHGELAKEISAGAPRVVPSRPTPKALRALEYWLAGRQKAKRAQDITSLAQDIHGARKIAVDAPELASAAAWSASGAKRQKQIAASVAEALSACTKERAKVVGLASFGGPPIAVISCGKQRLSLVPGGTVEMGFSEEEEAAVRAQAEVNAGCDSHFELYGQLLEQLDLMRPITHVHVGPLLVAQGPGKTFELDEATEALSESPFRLPSEAEWEHLARGGKLRELTYRGDVVPDEPSWFVETRRLGLKGANPFGLWGFGYEPELCADVYVGSHDDCPLDGSPRQGQGDRVVRGGAAQLYPWQDTGEWHMLLSAFRMPQSAWEFVIALRFVLGIECGARPS